MPYAVTCQHYYYSSLYAVEVSIGGWDYAGSDMLVERFKDLGEGAVYQDPREAVKIAIDILRAWRKRDPKDHAKLVVVNTGGMGIEGEPIPIMQAIKWAKEEWDRLPKCDQCGGLLPQAYYTLPEWGGEDRFCSEHCAEKAEAELICINYPEDAY